MNAASTDRERCYILEALARYWMGKETAIFKLPIPQIQPLDSESLPPLMQSVTLPEWSEDVGVNGQLLVPSHFIVKGEESAWVRTDWLSTSFWYLNGTAERAFEKLYGPIHSYSFRLKRWDSRVWDRAWVNRIALFLRRWAAKEQGVSETSLFGELPKPEIILTHDVDAVTKTMAIRLKQTAFHGFNSFKFLVNGQINASLNKLAIASKFFFSFDDYWCFDAIAQLEEKYGFRSYFNIYGGLGGWQRSLKQLLLDPAYNADNPRFKKQLKTLYEGGWEIGLHQSFNAWNNADLMGQERQRVEESLGYPVTSCRQHWLRFSWENTWKTQQEAGFLLDSTLGFNDRPGFRNGAAIRYHPWCVDSGQPMRLEALPMVLMDSHLYDYANLTDAQRQQEMDLWLDEIRAVRGTASVIWHQRVMSNDYGWGDGYKSLLSKIGS